MSFKDNLFLAILGIKHYDTIGSCNRRICIDIIENADIFIIVHPKISATVFPLKAIHVWLIL